VFPVASPLDQALEAGFVPPPILPAAAESPMAPLFNPDLALVQSVAEAAGGASQVHWAAGVVIVDGQRQLVVTSDRGRGWMPAAAVLPVDAMVPWWHEQAARWEGLLDPARVIVEYAAAAGGRVSALASTHSSAPAVAAGIPWAFADGTEQPHPEIIGGAVVTRFELQVCKTRRDAVRAITDPYAQRERALWVACDADSRAGSSPRRHAILTELQRHPGRMADQRWLNQLDWDALEAAHRDTCVAERAARVDVRDVEVGKVDNRGGGGRDLLAQAYADETVLALRQPVAEHALRDAVYGWGMLLDLPAAAAPQSPVTLHDAGVPWRVT
jgi:hypothetical protein